MGDKVGDKVPRFPEPCACMGRGGEVAIPAPLLPEHEQHPQALKSSKLRMRTPFLHADAGDKKLRNTEKK
jgi:hypothetical protein